MTAKMLIKTLAGLLMYLLSTASVLAVDVVIMVLDQDGRPVEGAVASLSSSEPSHVIYPGTAVIDQKNLKFTPQVSAVAVGTRVQFPNSGNVKHHVYSFSRPKQFELKLYSGGEAPGIVFDKPGLVKLGCNIHDWMRGYLYVLEEPYFGVTDSSGMVRLSPIAGEYRITARHPRELAPVEMPADIEGQDSKIITMRIDIDTRGELPRQVEPAGGFNY